MDEYQRIKKVINWLIYSEVATNERELAELLGYTKSSFSQIVNGRVPLSEKFIDKLCYQDDNINKVWVLQGVGNMFKTGSENTTNSLDMVHIPTTAWDVIQSQAKSLSAKDSQVDELISMLKEQINQNKKTDVLQDANAACADVG